MENTLDTRMVVRPAFEKQKDLLVSCDNEKNHFDYIPINIFIRMKSQHSIKSMIVNHNNNSNDSKMESDSKCIAETENSNSTTIFPFPQKKWNVLSELKRGATLWKKGRYGNPHFHQFNLSKDNSKLVWYSKNKTMNQSSIQIKEIKKIDFGEKTEKFGCVDCVILKSRRFTVIYGEDRALNLKTKSVNEMKMWVQALRLLHQLSLKGIDLSKISKLEVEVDFRDRNRPQSSEFSGNFLRSHETKKNEVDPVLHRKLLNDLETLKKAFITVRLESQSPVLQKSYECDSIQQILSELGGRFEELENELIHIRNTTIAEKDVLHMTIDLECLREKISVVCNESQSNFRTKIHQWCKF